MAEAQDPADADLDDVMARVRELPTRLRSLRVETRGWSDDALSGLASERARGLLVRHLPRRADAPVRRKETRVRSWMEFGEVAWDQGFIGLWPQRWREEFESTSSDGEVLRFVSARDGDSSWRDHGDGVKVTDARRIRTGLASAWVVGRRWVNAPTTRELVDRSTSVLGRSCIRVRVTPEPGRRFDAGRFYAGDSHDLVVDNATGMTLAVTSVVDGTPFHYDEVTHFEIDAPVAATLTEVPPEAVPVPASQHFESVEEIAAATVLSLLAPRWLPPEYTFQSGGVYLRDEVPEAMLVFSRDRREFVSLYEWPESRSRGEEVIEWERVERGPRTVFISDLGDQPGQRVAHTTLDGTWVYIDARLTGSQLLDLAFSLEAVHP